MNSVNKVLLNDLVSYLRTSGTKLKPSKSMPPLPGVNWWGFKKKTFSLHIILPAVQFECVAWSLPAALKQAR